MLISVYIPQCLKLGFYIRKLSKTFDASYASLIICKSNKWQRNCHFTQKKFLENIPELEPTPLQTRQKI